MTDWADEMARDAVQPCMHPARGYVATLGGMVCMTCIAQALRAALDEGMREAARLVEPMDSVIADTIRDAIGHDGEGATDE